MYTAPLALYHSRLCTESKTVMYTAPLALYHSRMRKAPRRLTLREIKTGLKALPGWGYLPEQKALGIECKLKDFKTAEFI
jgi:hypothetical protein